MNSVLNYEQIIITIWTVVILPVITYAWNQLNEYAKTKKLDKYTELLKNGIEDAVKDVQSTFVEKIKNTKEWNEDTKKEALELAKSKAIYALSDSAYKLLKMANEDFDQYLTTLIESKLYDLRK